MFVSAGPGARTPRPWSCRLHSCGSRVKWLGFRVWGSGCCLDRLDRGEIMATNLKHDSSTYWALPLLSDGNCIERAGLGFSSGQCFLPDEAALCGNSASKKRLHKISLVRAESQRLHTLVQREPTTRQGSFEAILITSSSCFTTLPVCHEFATG